jgi:endonuclease VIII
LKRQNLCSEVTFIPEGPEIHLEAKKISKILLREPLTGLHFANPDLQKKSSELLHAGINKIQPWGKAMLIYFNNGEVLFSHNQLYGKWMVFRNNHTPKTKRQVRIILSTKKGKAILYSATTIELLNKETLNEQVFIKKLGPDILWESTTEKIIYEQLGKPQFQRRSLGNLLLAQEFFAGIGNYLRSEILYYSKLHPDLSLAQLTENQRLSFTKAIYLLPRRSFTQRGVTVSKEEASSEKERGIRRSHYRFYVFGKDGWACKVCNANIDKIMRSSRRLYLCIQCQKSLETH